MKFKIEDSGEYRVICSSCHPSDVSLDVEIKAEAHSGERVPVAAVHVTGRLDWTQNNPLVDWDHGEPEPLTGAYEALEPPWYSKLARAFGRIFRPNESVSEQNPLA